MLRLCQFIAVYDLHFFGKVNTKKSVQVLMQNRVSIGLSTLMQPIASSNDQKVYFEMVQFSLNFSCSF